MKPTPRPLLRNLFRGGLVLALGAGLTLEGRPPRKARGTPRAIPRPASPKAPALSPLVHPGALAPFFEALRAREADGGRVRILHFGDSHTAADHWTGRIRQRLQARFGDGGPGFIAAGRPWRGYSHEGVKLVAGYTWPAEGLRRSDTDGFVGLAGVRLSPRGEDPFRFRATFTHLQVHVLGPGQPEVRLAPRPAEPALGEPIHGPQADPGMPAPEVLPLALHFASEPLGRSLRIFGLETPLEPQIREVAVSMPEGTALLGVDLLKGEGGLVYDELGLNGAELTDLLRWAPDVRRTLLRRVSPDLLVLAYGTNEAGQPRFEPAAYEAQVTGLLQALKAESGAPILVVGPLDRSHRKKKARTQLQEQTQAVAAALRRACLAADCAFWDARMAMGGPGAVAQWRRQGLAQRDLVHLTGPGYQKLGDALVASLFRAMAGRPRP